MNSRSVIWVFVFLALFVGAAALAQESPSGTSSESATEPLFRSWSDPFRVGDFTLTERSGQPFSPSQLRGKVWVAHFFFTTCPGPCVKTMPSMQRLQQVFAGKPDVMLVSITVRSAHDSVELLRDYAASKNADPAQWLFLTGAEEPVHEIIRKHFKQAAGKLDDAKDPNNDVFHTPNLMLVDRDGFIRGYVNGQDAAAVDALIHHVKSVAAEHYRLPAINAGLNALAGLLLVAGYLAIRSRWEKLHITLMLTALAVSALFLTSYLYFHIVIQEGKPTRFPDVGWVKTAYLTILGTHTVLAVVVAPLALYVSYLGLRNRLQRHVRMARWTLPLWLYVSVTGVVVYCLLYQLYPPY